MHDARDHDLAIRGSRPRPARGAAAFDAPSTRAPEPTQRTADDEPTYSTAARGGDGGRGRGRGRGASGMAPATTRTEEFSHPQRDEGDEWSTSAPPPAGQQTEQEGLPERTGLGKPNVGNQLVANTNFSCPWRSRTWCRLCRLPSFSCACRRGHRLGHYHQSAVEHRWWRCHLRHPSDPAR